MNVTPKLGAAAARPLQPVASTARLSEQVAQQLTKRLQQGELPPGAKLPTEAALALQLQVSRTVVREAVARLKSQGLLISRQGSGVYVNAQPPVAALRFDALVIARPAMLRGDRQTLGQPVRAGEQRWARLDALLRPLLPRSLRAIDAADVAAALVRQLPLAQGRQVLASGAMQGAAQA